MSLLSEFTGELNLTSKAKKILTKNTIDAFIDINTNLGVDFTTNKPYVEDLNSILTSLHNNDVLTVDFEKKLDNGVFQIVRIIRDDLMHDITAEHLTRQRMHVDWNIDLKVPVVDQPMFLEETNFDTYVALKYLHKKKSCQHRGIVFDLTLRDVEKLLKTKRCYYSGIELALSGYSGISFDRIDCTKPYTKGNVVACASIVNSLKNSLMEDHNIVSKLNNKEIKKMLMGFANTLD